MEGLAIYLGNKNYSSWSLRPWLALKKTGAPFSEEVIGLDLPGTHDAISQHSPSGRVPALRHGDVHLWESLAICEYLAETFPEAQLWPTERSARAHARAVSSEMHAGFAALRNAMPMNIRRAPAPIPHTPEIDADIARITALFSDCRSRYAGKGDYLFGRFTIADAMYAPVVTRFRSYAVPLAGAPAAYAETMWNDPAVAEWIAAARDEPLEVKRYQGI